MKAILSEKGQITIPQEIRLRLGLKPGQILDFQTRGGLLIAKKRLPTTEIDEVVGILSKNLKDVDAYLEETRGPKLSRKKD